MRGPRRRGSSALSSAAPRHTALLAVALASGRQARADGASERCPPRFRLPPAPEHALALNGAALPEACFNATEGPHSVFVIGDWGGISSGPGRGPTPADHRSRRFPTHARRFVLGVDNNAQQHVARQMMLRALRSKPDYVLNVGDNMYWGGVRAKCGLPPLRHDDTGQWGPIFEDMYRGPGLDGRQWLGVLGNHDYGGFTFTMGWDQAIWYTWGGATSTGRWVTPAQYWRSKVHYSDFSVDYYFVDSNVFDAFEPEAEMGHNICGRQHNPTRASCGSQGPASVCDCPGWFADLWEAQMAWLEEHLAASTANWQVVVTHFPPTWGRPDWEYLARAHGIDLLVTGHTHRQAVVAGDARGNFLAPTAWLVSGGGGGITAEGEPSASGEDDEYGFMELRLARAEIEIHAISHGGQTRSRTLVRPRPPDAAHRRPRPPPPKRGGCHAASSGGRRQRDFLRWILRGRKENSSLAA